MSASRIRTLVPLFAFLSVGLLGEVPRRNDISPSAATSPTLSWNTFLGGGAKNGRGIAVDGSGNIYVTGISNATWGAPIAPFAGGSDAYVAKFASNGALLWNTFLGGAGDDSGLGIAVGGGNIYVIGSSGSTWGAPINLLAGGSDAFAAKLDADGALKWNTFLGGAGSDSGAGIAVSGSGYVYVIGSSGSTWGAPINPLAGGYDAFAARIDPGSGVRIWNTFLGGVRADYGYGIAADGSGNIYLTGKSRSTWGSPIEPLTLDDYNDVFLAKLDSDAKRIWNTFNNHLSGFQHEGHGLALDSQGNIYVAGWKTYLYTSAFLLKFNSSGGFVERSLLGDSLHYIYGTGVVVDHYDNIYVSGHSNATWGSPLNPYSGGIDVFVAKFCSNFSLKWNTFLGGGGSDSDATIALDGQGNLSLTGTSGSTWGAPLSPFGVNPDAFVAGIADVPASSITLTSPNGGETFGYATTQNITWTSTGTFTTVKIEYSANDGGTWTSVISAAPNNGSYAWTVPNAASTKCRVRVSDSADNCCSDVSDAAFTATPAIAVSSPNGGESWTMGSTQNISWTAAGTIANVKIDYSINHGNAWTAVVASTPNTGSYSWTVPYTPGTECLVRVSDAADTSAFDMSDNVFTLTQATIFISVPNGGGVYPVGSTLNIVWAWTGSIINVALEYSTNGGGSWTLIEASTPNDGFYAWIISAVSSDQCLLRIRDASEAAVFDVSDSVFTMNASSQLAVSSPNGGETWTSGSTRQILWSSFGTALANVKIEYTTTNGVAWQTVVSATPNDGSYDWSVPAVVSTQCKIRVSDAADGSPWDASDRPFTIREPGAPLPGHWTGSTSRSDPVTFDVAPPRDRWGNFELEAPVQAGVSTIAMVPGPGVIAGGSFSVDLYSGKFTASGSFSSEGTATGIYNFSSFNLGPYGYFTQSGTWSATVPLLTVTSPDGGEVWEPGLVQNLTWNALQTVGDVKIEYSTDNGAAWQTIIASTPNDGVFEWMVPLTLSTRCKVRVGEAADGDPSDTSDYAFAIAFPVDLGGALDNTSLIWMPSGLAPWFAETAVSYFDGDAAQSGALLHSQSSGLNTTVNGPGTLRFYWQVSSEADKDLLSFLIDDIEQDKISGEVAWAQKTYTISAGTHTLRWVYSKNDTGVAGSDCAWVDKVEYTPRLTISGTITSGGAGVSSVMMNGLPGNPGTDGTGFYSATVDAPWSGTVTPAKTGYTFTPLSRVYTNVTADQIGQDFTAPVVLPPQILLSKSKVNFGVQAGAATPGQPVMIANSGGGTLYWAAGASASWITISLDHGIGSGTVTIGVNATGLSAGNYSGSIQFTGAGAVNSPQNVAVSLEVFAAGGTKPPFGDFATPLEGTTGVTGAIPVTGWVLDDIQTTKVEIWRDPVLSAGEVNSLYFIGTAIFVEGARPDVEAAYQTYPFNYKAGWGYMLLTNFLPGQGNGTFKLYAIASDMEGNVFTLGTKTIVCDNAHAAKPFGTIDTPAQGGDASGNPYLNFGWVLTPMPKTVPKNGSTITVYVDSVLVGNLSTAPNVYDQYRPDVSGNFPGLNNTGGSGLGGPVGAYFLNTTAYANGVHTIYWIAYDDAGQGDGIGSRYFNIVNTGSPLASMGNDIAPAAFIGDTLNRMDELASVPRSYLPILVGTGLRLKDEPRELLPEADGVYRVEIPEVDRVVIELGGESESGALRAAPVRFSGFLAVGDALRPLPVGSTLDRRTGRFSWMPGPGFFGPYDLVFIDRGTANPPRSLRVRIVVTPKR
jgi:hypothetical protein